MKEIRYNLSSLQRIFLEKVIQKIEGGWDRYGKFTAKGINELLDEGKYKESTRKFLNIIREDYIKEFCTTEEDEFPMDIT